tara:strand:- start:10887 stop:12329 length:1443 start_codon:yes stop_codon:yes gene_type:complete
MFNLFSYNPYRIIGVPSNAGLKKIQKNLSVLRAYSKIGKNQNNDYDLNCLNFSNNDNSQEIINNVESKILLDENKVKYSLYWFTDSNAYDSVALKSLFNGNSDKAEEIWDKSTKGKKINKKNVSSFNNFSSLLLFKELDSSKNDQLNKTNNSINSIRKALNIKFGLISSEFFNDFCQLNGCSKEIDSNSMKTFLAESILETLKKNYDDKDFAKLSKGLNESLSTLILIKISEKPIEELNTIIAAFDRKLKSNSDKNSDNISSKLGLEIGIELVNTTKTKIENLRSLMGLDNFQFKDICNKLANLIIDCGIAYWNSTQDISYTKKYINNYKYALSLASNHKTKERANSIIKHSKEVETNSVCKICDCEEKSTFVRVKMYRMNYGNSYSYFPDGGYKLETCKSCANKINIQGWLTFIYTAIPYGIMYLWALDLIALFWVTGRYPQIFYWLRRQMRKISYQPLVTKDPAIKKLNNEGYKLGMP